MLPDLGHRALDGLLVGANRPSAELDHGAAEVAGESIHDRARPACGTVPVAEDHRLDADANRSELSVIALSNTDVADADVDVGQPGLTACAQGRQEGRGVGNGDHVALAELDVGRADKTGDAASADSTASNAAR